MTYDLLSTYSDMTLETSYELELMHCKMCVNTECNIHKYVKQPTLSITVLFLLCMNNPQQFLVYITSDEQLKHKGSSRVYDV